MSDSRQRIIFVAPNPDAFNSGGNYYNHQFSSALRDAGFDTIFIPPSGIGKLSGQAAVVIDSLWIHACKGFMQDGMYYVLLTHHLKSLYPFQPTMLPEESAMLEEMDLILATGGFLMDYLLQNGIEKEKILLLEPAPDNALTRIVGDSDRGKIKGLIAANLIERKGILPLLSALAELADSGYFELRIAGSLDMDRDYAEQCISICNKSPQLRRFVSFTGIQDRQGMAHLFRWANCFISASLMETFGLSLQEAVIVGLPILALDRGNAGRHVREGENGLLFDTENDLARQFIQWAGNPEEMKPFHRRAQEWDPGYPENWNAVASRFLAILHSKFKDH